MNYQENASDFLKKMLEGGGGVVITDESPSKKQKTSPKPSNHNDNDDDTVEFTPHPKKKTTSRVENTPKVKTV